MIARSITFLLNGAAQTVCVSPTRRLVDILRDDVGLTGTKLACGIGRCGACTVLLGGQPVNACLMMAYQVEGQSIVTIEGLAQDGLAPDGLHPLQRAFLEAGGFQCGYCTPGMILAAKALLDVHPRPTPAQIREALSGNLCRCTGYTGILRAIQLAVDGGFGHADAEVTIEMEGGDVQ